MHDYSRPFAGETKALERARRDATKPESVAVVIAGTAIVWDQFSAHLRMGLIARHAMRDRDATLVQRDIAAVSYTRHSDKVMDLLEVMSQRKVLARIARLLMRVGRS